MSGMAMQQQPTHPHLTHTYNNKNSNLKPKHTYQITISFPFGGEVEDLKPQMLKSVDRGEAGSNGAHRVLLSLHLTAANAGHRNVFKNKLWRQVSAAPTHQIRQLQS